MVVSVEVPKVVVVIALLGSVTFKVNVGVVVLVQETPRLAENQFKVTCIDPEMYLYDTEPSEKGEGAALVQTVKSVTNEASGVVVVLPSESVAVTDQK